MKKLQTILNESSLSRLWQKAQQFDYGTITAFRYAEDCGTGTPYTNAQNLQRNSLLLNKLRAKGYSVTAIKGSYIENYGSPNAREVSENSFFVSDMQDSGNLRQDLVTFGKLFEQDSIIFGQKNSAGVLIGTSTCPDAYPSHGVEDRQGGALFGRNGEFMSRVNGRPFIFAEGADLNEYATLKFPTELRGAVLKSKQEITDI